MVPEFEASVLDSAESAVRLVPSISQADLGRTSLAGL